MSAHKSERPPTICVIQELTHGGWHDSDEASSVLSELPPDSGVLSSGVTSPCAVPAVEKVAELELIREKLMVELSRANKVRCVSYM